MIFILIEQARFSDALQHSSVCFTDQMRHSFFTKQKTPFLSKEKKPGGGASRTGRCFSRDVAVRVCWLPGAAGKPWLVRGLMCCAEPCLPRNRNAGLSGFLSSVKKIFDVSFQVLSELFLLLLAAMQADENGIPK